MSPWELRSLNQLCLLRALFRTMCRRAISRPSIRRSLDNARSSLKPFRTSHKIESGQETQGCIEGSISSTCRAVVQALVQPSK